MGTCCRGLGVVLLHAGRGATTALATYAPAPISPCTILSLAGANGTVSARNFAFHACLGPVSRQQDVVRLCGINQLLVRCSLLRNSSVGAAAGQCDS